MNLWGYRFFQNPNQKLQRFLPYLLINFQSRNLCNFWLGFWKKWWSHKFILKLIDLYMQLQHSKVSSLMLILGSVSLISNASKNLWFSKLRLQSGDILSEVAIVFLVYKPLRLNFTHWHRMDTIYFRKYIGKKWKFITRLWPHCVRFLVLCCSAIKSMVTWDSSVGGQ